MVAGAHGLGLMLAGLAATTTALAHGLLKGGGDRLARRAINGLVGLAGAAPVAMLVPLPAPAQWPWLAAACMLHVGYQLLLIASYAASDFGAAFPLARGVAPLLAGFGGIVWLGEHPEPAAVAGMALVSLGCVSVAAGGGMTARGASLAGLCGLATSAYSLVDAAGVRAAPNPLTFVAWFFILDGIAMPAVYAAVRRHRRLAGLVADWRGGSLSGLVSLVGFGSALAATAYAPVGEVSALRETSILFALGFAHWGLGERVRPRRAIGGLLIAGGAAAIIL